MGGHEYEHEHQNMKILHQFNGMELNIMMPQRNFVHCEAEIPRASIHRKHNHPHPPALFSRKREEKKKGVCAPENSEN